jgi:hypothetical protein
VALGVREERDLSELAVYEIRSQLARVAAWAEFYARRASRKGLWIAFSCELSWLDGAARLSLGFRVQRGEVEAERAKKYLEKRITLIERLLEGVTERLRREGVEVQVDKHATLSWGSYASAVSVDAVVKPVKVDANRFLGVRGRRWRVKGDSETWVGGVRTSQLKSLEAEVELEEVAEKLEEEKPEEELAGEGWVRASVAALKYGVPLLAITQLAREGRIQSLTDLDEEGKLVLYVKEEEVKKIAPHFKPKTEEAGAR